MYLLGLALPELCTHDDYYAISEARCLQIHKIFNVEQNTFAYAWRENSLTRAK